jgi:c-di-GMP-binding flagellar brake protein YcgR
MTDQLLKLQVGDSVQVQLFTTEPNETRYIVRVLGFQPGVSLLIHTPRAKGNALLLREGQLMTVRLLTGNTVYGFESRILRVCLSPFPYLHVAYPKEFESLVVRKAQRARTTIIASVENADRPGDNKEPFPAIIADLSTAGAMLSASMRMGEPGDSIMIRAKFVVGGIEKYLSVAAVIRGVREREGEDGGTRYHHGVEFQMLEPDEQLVLHGYVYEQIALGKAI